MSDNSSPQHKRVEAPMKFNKDEFVFVGGTRKVKTYKIRVHANIIIETSAKVSIDLQIN